jgi:hypothetical protein
MGYTVLPRNKLTLRFVRSRSCGRVRAVAVRAICGCGSCGLRSRFVRFFHRPQKTMASCSDVSRLTTVYFVIEILNNYIVPSEFLYAIV